MIALTVSTFSSRAITIDFNDLPSGSTPDSFHFPGARVHTYMSVLTDSDTLGIWGVVHSPLTRAPRSYLWDASEFGTTVASTRGQIADFAGSQGVVLRTGQLHDDYHSLHEAGAIDGMPDVFARIGVEFTAGISDFSVDVYSTLYSSQVVYDGFDSSGNPIRGAIGFRGSLDDEYTHLHVAAPLGGYITSFYFSMADIIDFPVTINMDNLEYTPLAGDSSPVPETGTTAVLLLAGLLGLCGIQPFRSSGGRSR